MVLTQRFLFTFKAQQKYNESPTERLRVQEFVTIKSAEEIKKNFVFRIETKARVFYICALDGADKELWIGSIGRAMVRHLCDNEKFKRTRSIKWKEDNIS